MSAEPDRSDTLVECDACGRTERVRFQKCLNTGWPTCHDKTMRLVSTDVSVEQATRSALGGHGVPGLMVFRGDERVDAGPEET